MFFFKQSKKKKQMAKNQKKQNQNQIQSQNQQQQAFLSTDLDQNLQELQNIYKNCMDVVFRQFQIGGKTKAALIYIDGLANIEEIDAGVLTPLMKENHAKENTDQFIHVNDILEQKLTVSKVKRVQTTTECIEQISGGNPVLLIDQQSEGFALGLSNPEKRSIEEPGGESVVRGPREGFTESLGTNLSLLRRKIRSPQLKAKSIKIGEYTQTEVVISYIEGIAEQTLIQEVEARLNRIKLDGILETSYIEELIEDNPYSPFPQILNTERPDVVAASLLEGRVAILQDGTPFVLVVPVSFYSLLQSSEDYYERSLISTATRWLRYAFLLVSLLLPSLYVAILTFHQEMLPTTLLVTIAASREQIPFPALVEALLMEIVFEALREAGLRLPRQAGAAVSIVGALVIGQAAIQAGLASAPLIMVVALTGIASFTIPRYTAGIALRMLRFPMIFLAGTLGLLGIMLGLLMIVTHMATLRSFGVPYLSPMAPMQGREIKDVLMRAPWWKFNTRPRLTGDHKNIQRQGPNQKPGPDYGDDKTSKDQGGS
ncbi:spore germination protein [Saccharococcus caldoxylosilyticus]|uniref:Spore germination protein GreKA n=1 Tax=Parageobacillus caldoxylosilyticus NBRC 107762 TaxID=1220594 RepID=A0A023DKG5_9BACL|nr:spore germination protein [Parageobacillus caldoxylosilyticus]MBB3853734.1 spore germination protein KA [Parageobacillus caldoxylosilyticus]GAJ41774.1 spore germination protein GreKA [Parageobacillus caldoxylosilyticus NBRC 107762]